MNSEERPAYRTGPPTCGLSTYCARAPCQTTFCMFLSADQQRSPPWRIRPATERNPLNTPKMRKTRKNEDIRISTACFWHRLADSLRLQRDVSVSSRLLNQ